GTMPSGISRDRALVQRQTEIAEKSAATAVAGCVAADRALCDVGLPPRLDSAAIPSCGVPTHRTLLNRERSPTVDGSTFPRSDIVADRGFDDRRVPCVNRTTRR